MYKDMAEEELCVELLETQHSQTGLNVSFVDLMETYKVITFKELLLCVFQ